MRAKDARGRLGEELAAAHLIAQGLIVLDRNWRCDVGEVDIVAREGDALVICEVKTRSSRRFGSHRRRKLFHLPQCGTGRDRQRAGSQSALIHKRISQGGSPPAWKQLTASR